MEQQAKSCGVTSQVGDSCLVVIQNAYSMGIVQSDVVNSQYVINPDEFVNYQGQVLTGTRLGHNDANAYSHSLGLTGQTWTGTGTGTSTSPGITYVNNASPGITYVNNGSAGVTTLTDTRPNAGTSAANSFNTGTAYRFLALDGTEVVVYGSWSGSNFIADSTRFPGTPSGNLELGNGSFRNFIFYPKY